MEYILLSKDWNAEPNAPEVTVLVRGNRVDLNFYLNHFLFDSFHEGDKAIVRFYECHKYNFNAINDEGYYMGKYRYSNKQLPWGEFYQVTTNWELDFPKESNILKADISPERMKHYIFFFRDNCFECVAENYEVEFVLEGKAKQ
jgi:hypothetical protein